MTTRGLYTPRFLALDLVCVNVLLTMGCYSYSHIWDAIRLVWPDSQWAIDEKKLAGLESRL